MTDQFLKNSVFWPEVQKEFLKEFLGDKWTPEKEKHFEEKYLSCMKDLYEKMDNDIEGKI